MAGAGHDRDALRRRREAARRRTHRQRRAVALALVGVVVLALAALAAGGGDDERGSATRRGGGGGAKAPPELPRGGTRILPGHRLVAYYGAPQSDELGALGIGTPDQAARRLARQARAYRGGRQRVLPVMELIATVASGSAGDDGRYRWRQPAKVVRRYLAAARRAKALLVLDVQPGRARFVDEVRALRPFLEEPDVGLALDPEWHVGPGEVPGRTLGSVTAREVNVISDYLARIVRDRRLPQKLLIVHQFTNDMVRDRRALVPRRELATVLDVDGFGTRAQKVAKYRELTGAAPRGFPHGIKLFYREDTGLMGARDVLRLRPRPALVVYE